MDTAKFAAISCVHVPHQSEEAKEWLLTRLQELKPTHFILLGDLFDASAVSVHNDEFYQSLEEEYEAGSKYLSDIRSVLDQSTKLVWCLGNHDDNIQTKDPRRTNVGQRSLLHWNKHREYGDEFLRWKQIPYEKSAKGIYRLGPIRFYHGFDVGANSDELETLQMAYAIKDQAYSLWIRGHTHRPTERIMQCRRTQRILIPWFYANAGTMGPLNPDYMLRKDSSRWGRALVHGECSLSSPRRPALKDWDAQVELIG
jgi:UDP-2,3-diacylglucosamine pyrophosphatase LpxH